MSLSQDSTATTFLQAEREFSQKKKSFNKGQTA